MAVASLKPTNGVHKGTLPEPTITGERATYKANGYLGKHVGMFFGADEPILLARDRLFWQVTVYFQMYDVGPFKVSFLDVDAVTGEVIHLADEQIEDILQRCNAFVKLNPSSTTFPL